MPAITDIPVPPAIIAPAKPASASSSSSPEGNDSNFATELAAAQGDQQQSSKEETPAKDALPAGEDASVKNTVPVPTLPVQVAETDWQPNASLSEEIVLPQADEKIVAQPQAAQPASLEEQLTQTEQVATPVEETKPEDKKADEADVTTLPVAAPVTDVIQAMLPTPVAQFGEAPAAQKNDAAKIEPTPDLRASVTEPAAANAAPAKSDAPAPQPAQDDQASAAAQAAKIEANSGEQQQQQNRDDNNRARDLQASQKTEQQKTDDGAAIAANDIKQALAQQAQQQPAQTAQGHNTGVPSGPQLAAASAISQPHSASHMTGGSAVNFTPSHQPLPAPDQIAFAISSHAKDGAQNFEIRLDPAELGRVDVKMSIDDAGNTQATLVVERPHTLELLKADSHNLEKALKESGLNLTQDGLSFSLKGQDRQAQQEQNAPFVRAKILNMELTAAETAQAHINSMLPPGSARLDIRV